MKRPPGPFFLSTNLAILCLTRFPSGPRFYQFGEGELQTNESAFLLQRSYGAPIDASQHCSCVSRDESGSSQVHPGQANHLHMGQTGGKEAPWQQRAAVQVLPDSSSPSPAFACSSIKPDFKAKQGCPGWRSCNGFIIGPGRHVSSPYE